MAIATTLWVFACVYGVAAMNDQTHVEPTWTSDVVVWSPATGSRSVAPLVPGAMAVRLQRRADHIFLDVPTADHAVAYQWSPETEHFVTTTTVPPLELPPGTDTTGKEALVTPSGRALLFSVARDGAVTKTELFDHTWRDVEAPPHAPIGNRTLLDLDGGALLYVEGTSATWLKAAILEPGAAHWTATPPVPDDLGGGIFPVAGGKVAYFTSSKGSGGSAVWDPRTGTAVVLASPNPMAFLSAATALDGGRVLIVGGGVKAGDEVTSGPHRVVLLGLAACVGLAGAAFFLVFRTRGTPEGTALVKGIMFGVIASAVLGAAFFVWVIAEALGHGH